MREKLISVLKGAALAAAGAALVYAEEFLRTGGCDCGPYGPLAAAAVAVLVNAVRKLAEKNETEESDEN